MMIIARNVWEYDVRRAGKTFLEAKGYTLSNEKDKYVVEIGNIFKSNKDLYYEFISEMKSLLIDNVKNANILRYYVDEVVVDKRVQILSGKYEIRERHILLYIDEKHNKFVKIYDDLSAKIAKNFTLHAVDLFKDVAALCKYPLQDYKFMFRVGTLIDRFILRKYDLHNYIIVRGGQRWIIGTDFEVNYHNDLKDVDIDKKFYFNLVTKYLRGLFS